MKIGIVRGGSLNKFEMQNYEPLTKYYDIIAFHSSCNLFDIQDIKIQKRQLISLEGLLGSKICKVLKHPFRVIGCPEYMCGLEKELKSVDIVHTAETFNAYSYQAIKAKKKYGIKVIVRQAENIPFLHENHPVRKMFKKEVIESADFFTADSLRAKNALMLEGVPEEKIEVIPLGINTDKFKPRKPNHKLIEEIGIHEDDFIILFIGRLVWEKGIYDLVYALKKLLIDPDISNMSTTIKLLIRGEGPEEQRIKKLIDNLYLSKHVIFVKSLPYYELNCLYNLSDIFVLPSIPTKGWQEQFGFVLIEAMATETPVISTLSGSIPEVVGNAGLLVQPNDFLSLYRAIKKLVLDEKLTVNYGVEGRKRVIKNFDSRENARKWKTIFESLI